MTAGRRFCKAAVPPVVRVLRDSQHVDGELGAALLREFPADRVDHSLDAAKTEDPGCR